MKTFALDSTNDLFLDEDGNIAILMGDSAIAQTAQNYAATLRGEVLLDVESGIPFFDTPFGKPGDIGRYEVFLRRRLSKVPGVVQIVTLTVTSDNGIVGYTAVLRTDAGTEVDISG